jgi:hypothetical protein
MCTSLKSIFIPHPRYKHFQVTATGKVIINNFVVAWPKLYRRWYFKQSYAKHKHAIHLGLKLEKLGFLGITCMVPETLTDQTAYFINITPIRSLEIIVKYRFAIWLGLGFKVVSNHLYALGLHVWTKNL